MFFLDVWKVVLGAFGCVCFGTVLGAFCMVILTVGKDDCDD